jgi:ribosomal protein L19E
LLASKITEAKTRGQIRSLINAIVLVGFSAETLVSKARATRTSPADDNDDREDESSINNNVTSMEKGDYEKYNF